LKPEQQSAPQAGYNSRKTYFLLVFYFVCFGFLVALLTFLIDYRVQVLSIDKALHSRYERDMESKKQYFTVSIASLDATLDSVVKNPITQRYLANPDSSNHQLLTDLMLSTITAEPEYMQVRLISSSGKELIRIDRNGSGKLITVAENELQNKSERYYFKQAVKTPLNKHWFSKLDLNVENGVIEQPIRPTIRAATPVKMADGQHGLFIINIDVSDILDFLILSPDFTVYIADGQDEILHHPDHQVAWSRYLQDRKAPHNPDPDLHQYELSLEQWLGNNEQLKLVFQPRESLLEQISKNNASTALIIAGIVLLISFPLSWLIALLPARLQESLSEANKELKRKDHILDEHVISSRTDPNGVITHVSERMCDISQYSRNELIGKNHNVLKHGEANSKVHARLWETIINGGTWQGEFHNQTKSGSEYWLKSIITPEYDQDGSLIGYMQIAQEISAQKKLEYYSVTDALTQISNRHRIDQVLTDEVNRFNRYGHGFSLILLDLDYFKSINDTWGHQAGDQTLIDVASALSNTIRKVDFVGRWGGEEFLVVCPSTDLAGACELAEKLRNTIQQLSFSEPYSTSASMGVVTSQKGESGNQLLKRADLALYQAKEQGRNRVITG